MTQPVSPALQAYIDQQGGLTPPAGAGTPAPAAGAGIQSASPYILQDGSLIYATPDEAAMRGAVRSATDADLADAEVTAKLRHEIRNYGPMQTIKHFGRAAFESAIPFGSAITTANMTPEQRRMYQLENEELSGTTFLGDLVGTGVQQLAINALLPGAGLVEGAAAKAAAEAAQLERVTAPLARRAFGHAATHAVEGASVGAQMAFNEESRANLEHDAERITHGALAAGVFQPILGVPLGLLGDRALAKKLAAGTMDKAIGTVTDEAVINARTDTVVKEAAQRLSEHTDRPLKVSMADVTEAPLAKAAGIVPEGVKNAADAFLIGTAENEQTKMLKTLGSVQREGREARLLSQNAERLADENALSSVTAMDAGAKANNEIMDLMRGEARTKALTGLVDEGNYPVIAQAGMGLVKAVTKAFEPALVVAEEGNPRALWTKARDRVVSKFPGMDKYFDGLYRAAHEGDAKAIAGSIDGMRGQLGSTIAGIEEALRDPRLDFATRQELQSLIGPMKEVYAEFQAVQRDASIFGEQYANAVENIYPRLEELYAVQKELRDAKVIRRYGEDAKDPFKPNFVFEAPVIEGLIKNPDSPATFRLDETLFGSRQVGVEGQDAFKPRGDSYFEKVRNLADTVSEHLGNNFIPPKLRQAVEDANLVTQFYRDQTRQAISFHRAAAHAGGRGGLTLAEGLLRPLAAAVGGSVAGPAGSVAAYGAASVLGSLFNFGKRFAAVTGVENLMDHMAERQSAAISEFIASEGKVVPLPKLITEANAEEVIDKLTAAAANPDRLSVAISAATEGLGEIAPRLTGLAAAKMHEIANYVTSQLPPPKMPVNILQPQFAQQRQLSQFDITRANRMLVAAFMPNSILSHPNREGIDTVKALYPNEYADMQRLTLETLGSSPKPATFSLRQKMFLLFDLPSDALQDPKRYVQFQELLAQATKNQPGAAPASKPIDFEKHLMTQTQKIEGQ